MVQERYLTKRTEVFDLRHPSESGHYGNRELLDAKKMAVPEFSFRRISQLPMQPQLLLLEGLLGEGPTDSRGMWMLLLMLMDCGR